MKLLANFNKWDRFTKLTFFIIVFGIFLRFFIAFFVSPAGDSTWHLSVARFIAREGHIPLFEELGRVVFWAPPLFHIVAAFFYRTFLLLGEDVALKSMNFVLPLFGSLSLIVFAFIAKHFLKKPRTVFIAVSFLVFLPIHIYYSTISHIDGFLTFWVLLAFLLALKKRFFWCSLVAGIGLLSKYNFIFILPVIIFLIFSNYDFKKSVSKIILFCVVMFAVGLPWYLRNLIKLGNPIFYFLNNLFKFLGFNPFLYETLTNSSVSNLFDLSYLSKAFLDFFGVPLGLVNNLSNINLPLMPFPLILWLVVISIFFAILVFSFFVKKDRQLNIIFYIFFISFLVMLILYLYDFGDMFLRLFLPAISILGLFFAKGVESILKTKFRYVLVVFLIFCFVLFSAAEVFKVNIAREQYTRYSDDFSWCLQNLPEDAVVSPQSTVLTYYLDRFSSDGTDSQLTEFHISSKLTWKKDPLSEKVLKKNYELIYSNDKTEFYVYERIN